MRLLHYEGEVVLEDESGQSAFMMENIRLSSGQALRTGKDSAASVGLDTDRIVTLNAETRVEFLKETDRMEMHLTQGSLFLDVQDKLDENEVLDIRTSTMAVGIRGTIVFVSAETGQEGDTVTLGVLEGTARLKYLDEAGEERFATASAGQKVTAVPLGKKEESAELGNGEIEISKLEKKDLPAYVTEQIEENPSIRKRVEGASRLLQENGAGEEDQYRAGGDWTWTQEVRLVAQSASKMYDGIPLTRMSDVLVYGLPDIFSIRVTAGGSQTDAGQGANPVADWQIFNAAGEDVTDHFKNVVTESGTLVVDPAPLTVWTDSAEKIYDGGPLTAPDAALTFHEGYQRNQDEKVSRSYLVTAPDGISYNTQILYGLCGATKVHASNPYTGEIREVPLWAGQRLTVCLHDKDQEGPGIEFKIEKIGWEELPEDILRIYGANPALLDQVCLETGWKQTDLEEKIASLPARQETMITRDGLSLWQDAADRMMTELTNVCLTVDSQITDYYDRPLGSSEARFTPVRIDDSIKVRATGTRTDAGTSINSYEIDWGTARPENYYLQEELGTLTVVPASLTVTTGSASRPYDGTPLTSGEAYLTGLAAGETAQVTATGQITDPGSTANTYAIAWGSAKESNYRVTEELGTLTVTHAQAELHIATGSAKKTYDGSPLTEESVTVTGLLGEDSILVSATGTVTDAGSAENTYRIDWGDTDPGNYVLTEELGTLTVTAADLLVETGSAEKSYDGSPLTEGAVTITGLQGDDEILVTATGTVTDAGSAENTYRIDWGDTDPGNYVLTEELGTLTVTAADLLVETGSAEKSYDGSPLTEGAVTITGLQGDDEILVTATGAVTDAGSAENSFTIDWGAVNASNYSLTSLPGTLEVTPLPVLFDLQAPDIVDSDTAWVPGDLTVSFGDTEGAAADSEEEYYDMFALAYLEAVFTLPGGKVTMEIPAVSGEGEHTLEPALTFQEGKESNYQISYIHDTVELKKTDLVIDLRGFEAVYSGEYYIPEGITAAYADGTEAVKDEESLLLDESERPVGVHVEFQLKNGRLSLDLSGRKDAGEYTLEPDRIASTAAGVSFRFTNTALTITPAPLTIRTGSARKVFDGTPLTQADAEADGLMETDAITLQAAGTRTDAGSAANTYTLDWGDTNAANYTVKEELGVLTVDPLPLVFSLGCFEAEYYGGPFVAEGIRCLCQGEWIENESEDFGYDVPIGYEWDVDVPTSVTALFSLPGCIIKLTEGSYTEVGVYTVEPELTFLSGRKSNYDISYTDNVMTITEPGESLEEGFGMKLFTAGQEEEALPGEEAGEPVRETEALPGEEAEEPVRETEALPDEADEEPAGEEETEEKEPAPEEGA